MGNRRGLRRRLYDFLVKIGLEKPKYNSKNLIVNSNTIECLNRPSFEDWTKEFKFGSAYLFKNERDISSVEKK